MARKWTDGGQEPGQELKAAKERSSGAQELKIRKQAAAMQPFDGRQEGVKGTRAKPQR